jgi:peptide/nickel transport system permease protein
MSARVKPGVVPGPDSLSEVAAARSASGGRRRAAPLGAIARRKSAAFGLIVLLGVTFGALLAPWVAPHDPLDQDIASRNLPPVGFTRAAAEHPLGTDPLGRDILSRLIYGARISLVVGFSAVVLQGVVGIGAGLLAGYYGGWVDHVLMRLVDIQLGIPFLVLAIAAAVVLGGGLWNIVLVLTLTGWVYYARVIRGEILSIREQDFVLAAHVLGGGPTRVLLLHLLPNVIGSSLVLATLQVARMIIAESSLSFLGIGIQPPTPSWGSMVADGRDYLGTSWWVSTLPGLAIALTSLGANLVGDWMRDVLDPTIRDV